MRDPSKMRSQTYCYAAGTHEHPRRLFRFSQQRRFTTAVRLLEAGPETRVLDYGSGDGYLLSRLLPLVPPQNLAAFEPMEFLRVQFRRRLPSEEILLAESEDQLAPASYDRIACLEVLEHLRPPAVANACERLRGLLAPGGLLLVSVPLEIGPSVLFKYVAARTLTRMDRWYTPREALRATFGMRVVRDAEGEFLSHRGYDHRVTRRELLRHFRIVRETFSPVPWARGMFNAQVFWTARHKAE